MWPRLGTMSQAHSHGDDRIAPHDSRVSTSVELRRWACRLVAGATSVAVRGCLKHGAQPGGAQRKIRQSADCNTPYREDTRDGFPVVLCDQFYSWCLRVKR
jgi:hypothetical protein